MLVGGILHCTVEMMIIPVIKNCGGRISTAGLMHTARTPLKSQKPQVTLCPATTSKKEAMRGDCSRCRIPQAAKDEKEVLSSGKLLIFCACTRPAANMHSDEIELYCTCSQSKLQLYLISRQQGSISTLGILRLLPTWQKVRIPAVKAFRCNAVMCTKFKSHVHQIQKFGAPNLTAK